MRLDDVFSSRYSFEYDKLIPLTSIQSEADKNVKGDEVYIIEYTEAEWRKKYPTIDPAYVFYAPVLVSSCVIYYDEKKHIWLNLPIMVGFDSGESLNNNSMLQKFIENFPNILKKYEESSANGNWLELLLGMPDSMQMPTIYKLIEENGPKPEYYELFKNLYPLGNCFTSMFPNDFAEKLMEAKSEEQKNETKAALSHLDGDIIRVYRGEANQSADSNTALSWTENVNVAHMFALKSGAAPRIVTGEVRKENVLEYFEGKEKEIVVIPGSVTITKVEELFDLSDETVLDIVRSINPIFQKTKQHIKKLYSEVKPGNQGHDEAHSIRVLFLALILGKLEGVSNTQLRKLADAAAYHDIGRNNDVTDEKHGENSVKIYNKQKLFGANKTTVFLIQNHCVDDTVGMNRAADAQEQKLLAIFKDADALDRLRFGFFADSKDALDVQQLRTKNAKKMISVAYASLKELDT